MAGAFDDLVPDQSLPVITDDGSNWNAPQPQAGAFDDLVPQQSSPGLLHTLAHPIQAVEDAWNYPGSLIAAGVRNVTGGFQNAASIPGDVATGKQPLDESLIPRLTNAALMTAPLPPEAEAIGFGSRQMSPSTDQLLSVGSQGFNDWRASPLRYDPNQFADWARQQKQGLLDEGINDLPSGAPDLHTILDGMSSVPPGALDLTPAELDRWRKELGKTAQGSKVSNPTQSGAASTARRSFSDFLASAPPTNAVDGALTPDMQAQVGGYRDAVANYATGKRAQFVDNIESNADLATASANSGHNGDNTLRQNVKSALRVNPVTGISMADRAGLNAAEQDALKQVPDPDGSLPGIVRSWGNKLGGGGGHLGFLGSLLLAKEGYEQGGVPGAVIGGGLPYVGQLLKHRGEDMTANRLADASRLIRSRSPLAAQMPTEPSATISPLLQQRLARTLMSQQTNPQDQTNAP